VRARVREASAKVLWSVGEDAIAATPRLLELLAMTRGPHRFEGSELVPVLAPAQLCATYLTRVLSEESDELLRWLAHHELTRLPVQAVRAIRVA